MSDPITPSQVKAHATPETGLYIIIDNGVYSMADFADEHPGGAKILKRVGGKGVFVFARSCPRPQITLHSNLILFGPFSFFQLPCFCS